ncbi:DsbA family protein [Nocardia sp. NPDC005366]|uniref:DsbA family oxidoreductase n=1 Tax=Nocardia sp. NPDC005366 TaxID=3156878 RepID=UPI0033A2F799
MAAIEIDLFVDYVCPYCYLAEHALAELRAARDVDVKIRPFELRPDPVPTLRPEDDYLPRVWNNSVYPMARRLDVDIRLPTISPQPRTAKAFVVLQLAEESGLAEQYSTAMYQAFFRDDRDIGQCDVIMDVATSTGLDAEAVRKALSSQVRIARHAADLHEATAVVKVTAVPTFVIGGRAISGVADATRLIRAVDVLSGAATPGIH